MENTIFIEGNMPSSKNSKTWTGKFLVWSKTAQRYVKDTKKQYKANASIFQQLIKDKPKPYKVGFKFIRKSKHKFDYVNPLQTCLDLMVRNGWIDDDNADEIIPIFLPYEYDKEKPGVHIKVF